MRSFSLVLLRRLLFRPAPSTTAPSQNGPPGTALPTVRLTLYDHLSNQTLSTLERLLLFALAHEASSAVRRKAVDTVTDLASQGMARGHGWHALQAQSFAMAHAGLEGHPGAGDAPGSGQTAPPVLQRECAFRIFAGCPNLVMDLQIDAVLGVFQRGLKDQESVEVNHTFFYLTNVSLNIPGSPCSTHCCSRISLGCRCDSTRAIHFPAFTDA